MSIKGINFITRWPCSLPKPALWPDDYSALVPNARAKGRGRTKLGETGQSVTPRPLERRVGRRTRKEWPLHFAFRSWLFSIRPMALCAFPRYDCEPRLAAEKKPRPTNAEPVNQIAAGIGVVVTDAELIPHPSSLNPW